MKLFRTEYFKPEHLYGQILLYLFDRPDKRVTLDNLVEHFNTDLEYTNAQLQRLLKDELITHDNVANVAVYGISYKGFLFIKQLQDSGSNSRLAKVAIGISAVAALISFAALFMDRPPDIINNAIKLDSITGGKVLLVPNSQIVETKRDSVGQRNGSTSVDTLHSK